MHDHEVCAPTPSREIEPYRSEHEGYMGNWGNTVDRWYRRAALVLWPREREFAVRAEASPAWALAVVAQRVRGGAIAEAREMTASLLPFWSQAARAAGRGGLLERAMRIAAGLGDPPLASSLLRPFDLERLGPRAARAFSALVGRYGEAWTRSLVTAWSRERERGFADGGAHDWLASLPRLCAALCAKGGALAARILLEDRWRFARGILAELRGGPPVSAHDDGMRRMARPVLGWLQGAEAARADELRDEALGFLGGGADDALLPCLLQVLRAGSLPGGAGAAGLDTLAHHCAQRLSSRLAQPERADGDWSIAPPGRCRCELCRRLCAFLADPRQRRLEWPLATDGRRHVHQVLDAHELPVLHRTRRSGRPFTLVLEKTAALFEREAADRRRIQADLEWLSGRETSLP